MPILLSPIVITFICDIFILFNLIGYLSHGEIVTKKEGWNFIQLWTVVVVPVLFLAMKDFAVENDCCSPTLFAPEHRIGIYTLIILYTIAFVISIFRRRLLPPLTEVLLNMLLIVGLILNVIFCFHFKTEDEGNMWWIFGNIPIIILLLINLVENHRKIQSFFEDNEYHSYSIVSQLFQRILQLDPIYRYPVMTLLVVPFIMLLSLFLLLFGQKPDSLIRAFTDTYKHGLSQLDYMCENVDCGGHFLCSVGANGHGYIVKPIRYGERNGGKIICNRQLLVSNAFEDLVQERLPYFHKIIRRNYNKVGNLIHRYYYLFNNKCISDAVYLLMKPVEFVFLLTLYLFDRRPEDRIGKQYVKKSDRLYIDDKLIEKYRDMGVNRFK